MRTRGFEKQVATLLSASGNRLFGLTAVEIATGVGMEVVQVGERSWGSLAETAAVPTSDAPILCRCCRCWRRWCQRRW